MRCYGEERGAVESVGWTEGEWADPDVAAYRLILDKFEGKRVGIEQHRIEVGMCFVAHNVEFAVQTFEF